MSPRGWIGVDLDGTLAEYDGWKGTEHIGPPIPAMVARVQAWLAAGTEVRIVTARCHHSQPEATAAVEEWCERHLGTRLKVTCEKDFGMIELWDDRAVQVETNTGRRIDETPPRPVSPEAAPPQWERLTTGMRWSDCPEGTEARDSTGCRWTRTAQGWKAQDSDTFPYPGAATEVREAAPPRATTPPEWGDPLRYLTDDRDYQPEDQRELVLMQGGNGDYYVQVVEPGYKAVRGVRICMSGGASYANPALARAIADAYRALYDAAHGRESPTPPMRSPLAGSPSRDSGALQYAIRLFASIAPFSEPESDVLGVLTQIDNAVAGLLADANNAESRLSTLEQDAADTAAELQRVYAVNEENARLYREADDARATLERDAARMRVIVDAAEAHVAAWDAKVGNADRIWDTRAALRAAIAPSGEPTTTPTDTQRLEWWFNCGMDDSVCDGSVDLWWADEEDGDAVTRVTHGTSLRDALDKAMRGLYDRDD